MAVYLVTWDLNREKPNYAQARATLLAQMERFQYMKDAGLDSVWFISTNSSAQQASDFIRQALDNNDRLIVTQIQKGTHQGWLSPPTWEWINARL
jgi:hypothetical protein